MKRHLMKDLPKTDAAVAQWCKDAFLAKVLFFLFLVYEQAYGKDAYLAPCTATSVPRMFLWFLKLCTACT